jgi:hypothetical protein
MAWATEGNEGGQGAVSGADIEQRLPLVARGDHVIGPQRQGRAVRRVSGMNGHVTQAGQQEKLPAHETRFSSPRAIMAAWVYIARFH